MFMLEFIRDIVFMNVKRKYVYQNEFVYFWIVLEKNDIF